MSLECFMCICYEKSISRQRYQKGFIDILLKLARRMRMRQYHSESKLLDLLWAVLSSKVSTSAILFLFPFLSTELTDVLRWCQLNVCVTFLVVLGGPWCAKCPRWGGLGEAHLVSCKSHFRKQLFLSCTMVFFIPSFVAAVGNDS